MTGEEIKQACIKKQVTFIPHHDCAICGEYTGWYLLGRWPPYEVAYCPNCGCSCGSYAHPDTWESIAAWVCDANGGLRDEYKWLMD